MVNFQGADFAFVSSLFGAVKLTKNADPDNFEYFRQGIGFDTHGIFFKSDGCGFGENVLIFCADMNLLVHIDNNKNIAQFPPGLEPPPPLSEANLKSYQVTGNK